MDRTVVSDIFLDDNNETRTETVTSRPTPRGDSESEKYICHLLQETLVIGTAKERFIP